MSLRLLLPFLHAVIAVTVAAMMVGAGTDNRLLAGFAAVTAGLVLVGVALRLNRPLWHIEPRRLVAGNAVAIAGRQNAILMAHAYGWGALAMGLPYGFTDLRWQHAWQYALAMALMAAGIGIYAYLLGREGSVTRGRPALFRVMQLTVLHGAVALGGVAFVVLSGKLMAGRADWLANLVFVAGGIAIVALSALAVITQKRLGRLS